MWVLEENPNESGKVHYLPCGELLIISRKQGHILLEGDSSISRQHASISIKHSIDNLNDPEACPEVRLRDLGAKYGTYLNSGINLDKKIEDERVVAHGDRIRFGMLTNTWRLNYHGLVVTTSAIQNNSKLALQASLLKLGGHLVRDWSSSCSYLVMDNITLTIKVVCALAMARHIVRADFFSSWADAVKNKMPNPDATKFLPPLQEMSINQSEANFSPNENRRQVLIGQTFIFPSSKQLKQMRPVVTLAGGNAVLLSEENFKWVSSTNYMLIQLNPEKCQDPERTRLFKAAKEILKSKGLRVIPESDIGLAILYKSTAAHCNPSFVVANILRRNGSSMTQADQGIHIYATETQDFVMNSASLTGTRIVPESGVSSTRRTPSTLPGTAFPSSNLGITTAGFNSSSMSTNASVLRPPQVTLLSQNSPEDKINVEVCGSTKRLRTASKDPVEPPSKRSNGMSKRQEHREEPEPTQPMEEQVDDILEVDQCAAPKFKPKFSPDAVTTHKVGSPFEESTVGRSIPFEPYTLPSLDTDPYNEDDIKTQQFTTVKEEHANVPIDELDCCSRPVKAEHISITKTTSNNISGLGIKEELRIGDPFSLTNTSERNRRRAEAKRKSAEGSNAAKDLFDLPTSSRVERLKKKFKTGVESTKKADNTEAGIEPFAPQMANQIATNSNKSDMTTTNECRYTDTSSGEWFGKKIERSIIINESKAPVKAEAAIANISMKTEMKYGDIAEITGALETTRIIVEFASLVKRKETGTVVTNNPDNTSYGHLKNFKKFKKNAYGISALPKIIGGKDLVAHDSASRCENWFRDNPDVSLALEDREVKEREDEAEFDRLFDLPQNHRRRVQKKR